jgi:hypothetical protein
MATHVIEPDRRKIVHQFEKIARVIERCDRAGRSRFRSSQLRPDVLRAVEVITSR